MRVSSLQIFNIANNSFSKVNEAIVKTQEQLSTQQRVIRPSDDPVASTKIIQSTSELKNIEQYQNNITIAKNDLSLEEGVLQTVDNIIVRIRETAIRAGNTATLSPNEYQALASEVDSRLDELMNILNSQNVNGDYIFGGYNGVDEPFSGSATTGFSYQGTQGQKYIKVAHTTYVPVSDSGKALFVDIPSDLPTIETSTSPTNQSSPPIRISVGQITDQSVFNNFFPQDMVVTFNSEDQISPVGKNFTITEKTTGRILIDNQRYSSGNDIELEGVRFKISGSPISGTPPSSASLLFGQGQLVTFPQDFSGVNQESFQVTVNGQSVDLILDQNLQTVADVVSVLTSVTNGNSESLEKLGLRVDDTGLYMEDGFNITVSGGSAAIDNVLGLDTRSGTTSNNGVLMTAGDRVFVESSQKQDLLTTLGRFSEAMKAYDNSDETRSTLTEVISVTLINLDNAHDSVLGVTAEIGARVNTLESVEQLHLDTKLITEKILSDLRDVDFAEAATLLASQSVILQAAQSSFLRVSQLTLFSQL